MKNKTKIQESDTKKLRIGPLKSAMCFIFCILFLNAGIDANAGAFEGAAVGGFMGLIFGDDIDDVAAGAVVGGTVGAVSGSMKQKEAEKRAQQQREQEQRRIQSQQEQLQQEQRRIQSQQAQLQQQQAAAAQQGADAQPNKDQALIRAVGEDNYRGLLALIDCEHKRAEALAGVGAASEKPDHQLASLWLKALIANDLRQNERTTELYPQIVAADRDIDTTQQASLETDKVLMDVRQERREKGIVCPK